MPLHSSFRLLAKAVLFSSFALFCFPSAFAQKAACTLLQTAELESALGGKAGKLADYTSGSTKICSGKVGKYKVVIRAANPDPSGGPSKASQGFEVLRSQGWKVTIKNEGNLILTTAVPPASEAKAGCRTVASLFSNGKMAAVEVVAKSEQEMAATEAVASLVKKVAARM